MNFVDRIAGCISGSLIHSIVVIYQVHLDSIQLEMIPR